MKENHRAVSGKDQCLAVFTVLQILFSLFLNRTREKERDNIHVLRRLLTHKDCHFQQQYAQILENVRCVRHCTDTRCDRRAASRWSSSFVLGD